MKTRFFLFIIFIVFLSFMACKKTSFVNESKSNLIPMYGGIEKSVAAKKADTYFIKNVSKDFDGDQIKASEYFSEKAWEYYYNGDFDMMIKKANQAWLLDNKSFRPYWLFAVHNGIKRKWSESIDMFEVAKTKNPSNSRILTGMALTYGNMSTDEKFTLDERREFLLQSETLAREALKIEPNLGQSEHIIGIVEYSRGDFSSALKYFERAKKHNYEFDEQIMIDCRKKLKAQKNKTP